MKIATVYFDSKETYEFYHFIEEEFHVKFKPSPGTTITFPMVKDALDEILSDLNE